jgi:hypothetical protein
VVSAAAASAGVSASVLSENPPLAAAQAVTNAQPSAQLAREKSALGFSFHAPKDAVSAPSAKSESVKTGVSGPKTWEKFVELSFEKMPMLSVILESAVEWELPQGADGKVRLGFREKDRAKIDQLLSKSFREAFLNFSESFFGFKAAPEPYVSAATGESMAEKSDRLRRENQEQKLRAIHDNAVVQEAKALFNAELSQIEITERNT